MANINADIIRRAWECGILAQRSPKIYLRPSVNHAICLLNLLEKRKDGATLDLLTSKLNKAYNTNAQMLQILDRIGAISVTHRSASGAPNIYHLVKRNP